MLVLVKCVPVEREVYLMRGSPCLSVIVLVSIGRSQASLLLVRV